MFGHPGSASGCVSQKYGPEDPDPHPDPYQNVTDPQHCSELTGSGCESILWSVAIFDSSSQIRR
jgi:hypothetical protein